MQMPGSMKFFPAFFTLTRYYMYKPSDVVMMIVGLIRKRNENESYKEADEHSRNIFVCTLMCILEFLPDESTKHTDKVCAGI